jgi:hypothetical protein
MSLKSGQGHFHELPWHSSSHGTHRSWLLDGAQKLNIATLCLKELRPVPFSRLLSSICYTIISEPLQILKLENSTESEAHTESNQALLNQAS